MNFENQVVFISGANRGIGKALVEALLKHPVKKIYAAARKIEDLPNFGDARVVPIKLDITNDEQVKAAAEQATDVDLLINNAGVASHADLTTGDLNLLNLDMNINYFGTVKMVRAFIPLLQKKGQGSIANVISVLGLASVASIGGYCASKAALFSATQAFRAELKNKKINVYGIFPGPIDTDMTRHFEIQKADVHETAESILKGIEAEQEDIFPDPMSMQASQLWSTHPKDLERQFASN